MPTQVINVGSVEMKSWLYHKGPMSIGINAFAMQVSSNIFLIYCKLDYCMYLCYKLPKSTDASSHVIEAPECLIKLLLSGKRITKAL